MNLSQQRKLASKVLGVSPKRIRFDGTRHEDIKEAITREDIRGLVSDGAIIKLQEKGISQGRARHIKNQKKKGLRKGQGSRKGSAKARSGDKTVWVRKIRVLRKFLRELREKEIVARKTYSSLIRKAKGGFFRNRRHVKVFIEERQLAQKKGGKQ